MVVERLREIAEKTVQYALQQKVSQAQAVAFLLDNALTRFANSRIHQNVDQKSGGVAIKVVLDKRISTVQADTLDESGVKDAVQQAIKIAKASSPNKDFKNLPEPEPWKPVKGAFDKETAECTPMLRAEKVKEAIETAHEKSPKVTGVAGYLCTQSVGYAVANSLGVSAWAELTLAYMKTTVISQDGGSEGFGTAEQYSRRFKDIKPSVLADDAAEKSVRSLHPVKIEPGEYEVVLSPLAVSVILTYMGMVGFSATAYQDGQSFVKYLANQQVFDSKLNLVDNARNPKTLYAVPVDGEGVPKKPLELIVDGKVSEKSICYNSFTAGKEGKKSTGHALPPMGDFYRERPAPYNMILEPGDAAVEEAIEDTKHGIFVTTFHYVNPVEPTKLILTGLTRDGTFLIEKGEITKPIVNMRFTDSMLSAFKEVPMVGETLEIIRTTTVPMVKLKKMRFVGVSAY
ncbi:MAG: TldD/PmbA family protein [Candidatus Bathyarchaeota archaeon]|nr:TldD/PmbA family protein [Candidatus Bathyarchaeota archaeon]MDW8040282.1 TldD/PmbA family protein [Nitrososphaerota archaeon]